MVLWCRVAAASPVHTSRLQLEFAHSLSCHTRQRSVRALLARKRPLSRSQGVQIRAKLPLSRKSQVASAIFAGALAVWVSRDTTLYDLPADNQGAFNLPAQPVAYQGGSQEIRKNLHSASKGLLNKVGKLFATMNTSHAELINSLCQTERLTDKTADAMLQVDRKYFLDPDNVEALHLAYQDHPVPIGYGETISAPHMHAEALRLLEDHCPPGASVLDVGSGSGYLTGCLGIMVGESGQVLGVEKHRELAERSMTSLSQAVPELMKTGTVKIMPGNVLGKVLKEYGPFDAIHVGAAAATMPQNLVQKLKPGGRMVIPVGAQNSYQVLKLVDKDQQGKVQETDLMSVAFVPLTEPGTDPFVGKDEV